MRGRERRGEEGKEEKGSGGKGEEGRGREAKNDLTHPLSQIPGYANAHTHTHSPTHTTAVRNQPRSGRLVLCT